MQAAQSIVLELVTFNDDTGEVVPCLQLPVSAPTPEITLNAVTLTLDKGQRCTPGKWTGDLYIEGKILSGVASLTPGTDGEIKEILLDYAYDHRVAKIPVHVNKYASGSPSQPFLFEGSFEHRIRLDFLDAPANHFRLVAQDPVYGRNGDYEFVFEIQATVCAPQVETNQEPIAEQPPFVKFDCRRTDWHVASRQSHYHPLLCRVRMDSDLISTPPTTIPTLKGKRKVVKGPGGFWFLADRNSARPEVLLVLADDAEPPLVSGFPPEMHPWYTDHKPFASPPADLKRIPFKFHQTGPENKRQFVEGFKRGFACRGFGLYAGRLKLASLELESSKEISWHWTKTRSNTASMRTTPAQLDRLPIGERIGDIIFRMFTNEEINGHDLIVSLIYGRWDTLGIQDLPDEYHRVLEFSRELFEEYLRIQNANENLDEAAHNMGRAFREALAVLAPFSNPKAAIKQLTDTRQIYWLGLMAAKLEPFQSKSDKVLQWLFIKAINALGWCWSRQRTR